MEKLMNFQIGWLNKERLLFVIGAANRKRGFAPSSVGDIRRAMRAYYRDRRVSAVSD